MTWTLSRRIAAGYAVGLVLLVVLAVFAAAELRQVSRSYQESIDGALALRFRMTQAVSDFRRANVDYLGGLLRPSAREAATRDSVVARVRGELTAMIAASTESAEREALSVALGLLREWDDSSAEALRLAGAGRMADALRIRESRTAPLRDSLRDVLEEAAVRAAARAESSQREAALTAGRARGLLLAGTALALVVGLLAGVLLFRAIAGPLRETGAVLATSSAQILSATTEQASGAAETSTAVAETVTTIEEVAQTAEQAALRAGAVAETARNAAELGIAGRKAVEDAVGSMGTVRSQVEVTASRILSLAEQAQEIGEIIASVNEVSERVHLLALNAAIEAARAGEQGRGFSVVAAEIRALSDQSKRSTQEVRQILGEIQRATSAAVMAIEQGSKQVSLVERQVTDAGETIRGLSEAVDDAAQAAAQIAASAGQQAGGLAQVREAMANIRTAAQQNLVATQQTERTARDLAGTGTRLAGLIGVTASANGATRRAASRAGRRDHEEGG
jgi:hypothetical protein